MKVVARCEKCQRVLNGEKENKFCFCASCFKALSRAELEKELEYWSKACQEESVLVDLMQGDINKLAALLPADVVNEVLKVDKSSL